jgi:glycosyltransferase involved in cell wall biosynthesis
MAGYGDVPEACVPGYRLEEGGLKIAYVITRSDAVGGASVHVTDMAREVISRGHGAIVLVGGKGPVTKKLAAAGIPFHPIQHLGRAIRPLSDTRAFSELRSALQAIAPDIVSAHTAKAGWLGRAVCARLGLPVIYTPHGWPIGSRFAGAQAGIYRVAERMAARWSDAIVCVCEYERRLAIERGVALPDRLKVIHNGVHDIPAVLRAHADRDPPVITCVARFEAPKDHLTLLEALGSLVRLDWELELIGDGPLEAEARAAATVAGIADRVRFLGYIPDPAPLLARAQIFVLSSRSEGFPRSVLEAMRAGLPVVASDVGGVAEAVQHRVSGFVVPPGSTGAMADALKRLITSNFERQRMGASGHHIYDSRFRFEHMAGKTLDLYQAVLLNRKERLAF